MRPARCRIIGRFDRSVDQTATVVIDRRGLLFSVRPYQRRRTYELPLSVVAEMVVHRVIKAELAEKRRERAERRKIRRRA